MKELTSLLLIVALCLIALFSCGNNSSSASVDGKEESENLVGTNNPTDKLSKKEVIDRMNRANQDPSQKSDAIQMVKDLKNIKTRRLGEGQAKQSTQEQIRRYEEVKDEPASADQRKVANQICGCLNSNPLFKTAKKSKSSEALIKTLGEDKDKEVKAMQDCYSNIMVPAVKDLGKDAGIFSKKSRKELNRKCLNGKNDFWIHIGAYLTRNNGL